MTGGIIMGGRRPQQDREPGGEFGLIERILAGRPIAGDDVLVPAGDDAAVVRGGGERCWLFTCDAQVKDVHFGDGLTPQRLGRRLCAVNLSDIAAMGGVPRFALASLLIPPEGVESAFFEAVYDGLWAALSDANVALVGGNISGTRTDLALELFVVGEAKESELLLRRAARPGQLVCVTGRPGESAAGLAALRAGRGKEASLVPLVERHELPTARLFAGRILAASKKVGACIDVSDGLVQDASHICASSAVSMHLHADRLPVSAALKEGARLLCGDEVRWCLHGGEDYELLFTVEQDAAQAVCDAVRADGLEATIIGEVRPAENRQTPVTVWRDGAPMSDMGSGFDHLRSRRGGADV